MRQSQMSLTKFGPVPGSTLQLRIDSICLSPLVPCNAQNIRFATYLAVLNIALPATRRLIYAGFVPLSATRTLKAGIFGHTEFLPIPFPVYRKRAGFAVHCCVKRNGSCIF
jgi:hypothetical protein